MSLVEDHVNKMTLNETVMNIRNPKDTSNYRRKANSLGIEVKPGGNKPCETCYNHEYCKTCLPGYLLENNTCHTCHESCNTCSLTTRNCTSCRYGEWFYSNKCFSQCDPPLLGF